MAEDKTTSNAVEAEDKAEAKPTRRRTSAKPKKGDTVKVKGLVSTMYLGIGDEVTVTATEQLLQLADRGYVRLQRVSDDG